MFPDFEQLLSSLNAEGANYLIVGGYAVSEHAQPLAKFGAPVAKITSADLAEAGMIFRIGVPRSPWTFCAISTASTLVRLTAVTRSSPSTSKPDYTCPTLRPLISLQTSSPRGRPQDLADVAAVRDAAPQQQRAREEGVGRRHGD
ncbi:MAG: hypothetical protein ABI369_12965 [Acetobacteraceae bacterium]